MKKNLILLLLLTAALLIPSPAALASPIDGTWRLESGTMEAFDSEGDFVMSGSIIPGSVRPSSFRIEVKQGADGLYYFTSNAGRGITCRMLFTFPNGETYESVWDLYEDEDYEEEDDQGFQKISETEYRYEGYDDYGSFETTSVVLSGGQTLTWNYEAIDDDGSSSGIFIYERVGGGGGGGGSGGGGGGGCDAGFGAAAILLFAGLAAMKKRRA